MSTARLRRFGEADHVRLTSTAGFLARLREAGFDVTVDPFEATPLERARRVLAAEAGCDHMMLCVPKDPGSAAIVNA